MRKFFVIVFLFLGITLVILSVGELETIVKTIRQGNLWFLLLALLLQLAGFGVIGQMYRSIYRLLNVDESALTLSLIAAAANFVNVVAPTAGVGGIALFATEARRRGHPSGKATVAGALFLLFDQAAFSLVLALGLLVLFRRNNLGAGEITASLLFLLVAGFSAFLLYLGYRSAARLGNALARLAHLINWLLHPFIHRQYLSEQRAHEFAAEVADGLAGLSEKPRSLLIPILLGLLNKTLLMGILSFSFLSFAVPFSIGTIIGGFAIGYLFLIVSPTPSGIGVVEGVMAIGLSSLRVPWSQAVVITLVYRAITFWVPLGVGALAFRTLHLNGQEV